MSATTFSDVIDLFNKTDIDIRYAYWHPEDPDATAPFVVVADGEEYAVESIAHENGRIVVRVIRPASSRSDHAP